jgi:hypothetical protein
LLWRGIDDLPITPTVVARNRLHRSAIAINLPAAQIYRDLHHILLCSGLWRESGQIVESFRSVYAVPRISSGIREYPAQHIGGGNDTQLRQLPFSRTRTYPPRSLELNSLNKRLIRAKALPNHVISKMPTPTNLPLIQDPVRVPSQILDQLQVLTKR